MDLWDLRLENWVLKLEYLKKYNLLMHHRMNWKTLIPTFNIKNWAFVLCIAFLATSCNRILNSKPSGTLSENQMVDILVDIHLTEASLIVANDSIARLNDTLQLRSRFAQVFVKQDVNPDDFNSSLTYYLEHIEDLDKIYKEVIKKLTELEATLQPKTAPSLNRFNPDQKKILMRNLWYKAMNKSKEPEEIQYINLMIYPLKEKVSFPEPLSKQP